MIVTIMLNNEGLLSNEQFVKIFSVVDNQCSQSAMDIILITVAIAIVAISWLLLTVSLYRCKLRCLY